MQMECQVLLRGLLHGLARQGGNGFDQRFDGRTAELEDLDIQGGAMTVDQLEALWDSLVYGSGAVEILDILSDFSRLAIRSYGTFSAVI